MVGDLPYDYDSQVIPCEILIEREDQRLIQEEREINDGSFYVRCINERCYRIHDRADWGEGQTGIYLYFELPE